MRAVGRIIAVVVLGMVASACIVRSSGPDENRAEAFEFVPVPVAQQEAAEAFRSMIGSGRETLDEPSVVPLGKFVTSAGSIVFAEFQTIDPQRGRQQCSGSAGPTGGGMGCGPLGQEVPDGFQLPPITLSASGSSGTWSDVEMRVTDLGSLFLGRPSASARWHAGHVRGDIDAVQQLDRLFRTAALPFCYEVF